MYVFCQLTSNSVASEVLTITRRRSNTMSLVDISFFQRRNISSASELSNNNGDESSQDVWPLNPITSPNMSTKSCNMGQGGNPSDTGREWEDSICETIYVHWLMLTRCRYDDRGPAWYASHFLIFTSWMMLKPRLGWLDSATFLGNATGMRTQAASRTHTVIELIRRLVPVSKYSFGPLSPESNAPCKTSSVAADPDS